MTAKKMITLTQDASTDGHKPGVRATLLGLGLGRPRATRQLEDTPSIRGMIFKVRHLVTVDENSAAKIDAKPVAQTKAKKAAK